MTQNRVEECRKGRARRKNPFNPNVDGKRRATLMKRVHMVRKRGERIEVTFDEKGQPEGKHGDELMSWIGLLAREHVPIWIQDWRSHDLDGLKEIIWKETVTSFTVDDCFRSTCLKSCGEAARNFRHDLYKTFVEDFVRKDSVWTRPQKVIDNYPNIEEDDWVKFVRYKTSSQFQQLSDRGSEIRTNNEYISRGDRDGYGKLDQKKMQYNTQESQSTFKSVGTIDGLNQALSKPEQLGRIRGQSKFVKQSQYFNLNRSSNRDNEILSMRRDIEELKALVRVLCAKTDVEPSFDQENVPTVDQQNSFKGSCSVQEKQLGVSDLPTMPVDSQECKLYIVDELHGGQLLVAIGRAWMESLPTDTVHGILLGEGNVRVSINVPKLKKAALPIPTYKATIVEEAVNGFVAWPKTLIELNMSMNKVSRGPSHVPDQAAEGNKRQKKLRKNPINSRTEVQLDAQQQKPLFNFDKMNKEMKPLAYYANISMRKGYLIEVPILNTISGTNVPVFLNFDDIYEFITFQQINANCILVYLRYLEELCRINGRTEKFAFVSPTLISPVIVDTPDAGLRERADALVAFLHDAPKGQLYLVPYNEGGHWVLGVIDPWENLVLYFDPLRHKKRDDFTNLVNMALTDWKLITGEGIRKRRDYKTKISDRPCPHQEGSVECGYFVLGFMRDIVLNGIDVLERKEFFTYDDMDLIRGEWARYVMQFINYDL